MSRLPPQSSGTDQQLYEIRRIVNENRNSIINNIYHCIDQANFIRPDRININVKETGIYIDLIFMPLLYIETTTGGREYWKKLTFVCHTTDRDNYGNYIPNRIHCKIEDDNGNVRAKPSMYFDYDNTGYGYFFFKNCNNVRDYNKCHKDRELVEDDRIYSYFHCIFINIAGHVGYYMGGKKIKQNKRKQNRSHKRRKTRKSKSRKSKKNRTKKYKH